MPAHQIRTILKKKPKEKSHISETKTHSNYVCAALVTGLLLYTIMAHWPISINFGRRHILRGRTNISQSTKVACLYMLGVAMCAPHSIYLGTWKWGSEGADGIYLEHITITQICGACGVCGEFRINSRFLAPHNTNEIYGTVQRTTLLRSAVRCAAALSSHIHL